MTTTEAGRRLGGVSGEFVRLEIRAGRLEAEVIQRPGRRNVYRITTRQLDAYKASTSWKVPRGTINQPNP